MNTLLADAENNLIVDCMAYFVVLIYCGARLVLFVNQLLFAGFWVS